MIERFILHVGNLDFRFSWFFETELFLGFFSISTWFCGIWTIRNQSSPGDRKICIRVRNQAFTFPTWVSEISLISSLHFAIYSNNFCRFPCAQTYYQSTTRIRNSKGFDRDNSELREQWEKDKEGAKSRYPWWFWMHQFSPFLFLTFLFFYFIYNSLFFIGDCNNAKILSA